MKKNGNAYTNSRYLDMSIPYAAGSLYSTVEDFIPVGSGVVHQQVTSSKIYGYVF